VTRTRAAAARVRPWTGALETPLLRRIEADVRAGPWPEFRFLERRPIPWCPPPAARARVALVTSAGLHLAGARRFRALEEPLGDASLRRLPHAAADAELDLAAPYLDTKFLALDREVALPRRALERLVERGLAGGVAAHHYSFCGGVLAPYPQLSASADELLAGLREDEVDAVVFVPTCSICVQTLSLAAAEIEERGLPTVTIALLPELARIAGAPRALSTHFPLGAPLGDPGNGALHEAVLAEALELLHSASAPGTQRTSELRWRREP
jgi:hypothetical protein